MSSPIFVVRSTPVRGSDFSKKNGKGGGSSYDVTANNNDVAMSDYSEGGNCIARKRQRLDDYAYEVGNQATKPNHCCYFVTSH